MRNTGIVRRDTLSEASCIQVLNHDLHGFRSMRGFGLGELVDSNPMMWKGRLRLTGPVVGSDPLFGRRMRKLGGE